MKVIFPFIFFSNENTVKLSSVVSRKTDLKPWVNFVSVKSKVVNKSTYTCKQLSDKFPLFSCDWKIRHLHVG
jgi:hypothetical protein